MNNENKTKITDSNLEKTNTFINNIYNNSIEDKNLIGFFSFRGRTGRLEFFKIDIMIFLLLIINLVYFFPIASEEYISGFFIVYFIITLATVPIEVRRLHDSNLSGLYYFIGMIPNFLIYFPYSFFSFISLGFTIYYLYLIFRAGDPNPNDYGPPNTPKKYGNKTINFICILLFILIIFSGILAMK